MSRRDEVTVPGETARVFVTYSRPSLADGREPHALTDRASGGVYVVSEGARAIGVVAIRGDRWTIYTPSYTPIASSGSYGTRRAAALALVVRARAGHGGRRPGAGRPPSGEPQHDRISVTLAPGVLERLDRAAGNAGESRSAFLSRLVDEGLAAAGYGRLEVTA